MAARATINVVSATANIGSTTEVSISTAYVAAASTTEYELIESIAYLDEDSNNRWTYEVLPLGDLVVQIVNKNLSDTTTVIDANSLSFEKLTTDSFAFIENFTRAVSYNRSFTDAFTLDDLSQIDKDFYGNKGNIFAFTDIVGLTHDKALTDSYTVADVNVLVLNKLVQDSFSVSEEVYTVFSKVITDAFALDDAALVDKDYYGNKGNTIGMTEVFARAVDYKRDLSGSTSLNNEGLNSNLLGAQSPPETRVLIQDVSSLSASKNVADTVSFAEVKSFSIAKFVYDAFALDDSTQVNKDYTGSKGNILSLSEVMYNALDKIVSDSFAFDDSYYSAFTKRYSNDTVSFIETRNKNSTKVLLDSFLFSDTHGLQLVKTLSDGFALDDSTLIDKNYFGNKGNIVGISDQVTVDYYYGGLVGQRPLNTMSLN